MQQALLFQSLDNNSVRCTACKHYCTINPGKRGKCGVRLNNDGTLFSEAYGSPVAFQIDPIEKKPLYHFFPGSDIASIGTLGCNFSCTFCQNSSLSTGRYSSEQNSAPVVSPEDVLEKIIPTGAPSIAFTYNEPTVFAEYVHDIAQKAHEKNIRTVIVSNGFESSECLDYWKGLIDAANIDLKSFSNDFYKEICGGSIAPVLKTIETLLEQNVWVEITTLLIPGFNDSEEELNAIASYILNLSSDIPWHITAFHPAHKMRNCSPTPEKIIRKAVGVGKQSGLRYVYGGNVAAKDLSETRCPSCGDVHFKRTGYRGEYTSAKPGICENCGAKIAGRY